MKSGYNRLRIALDLMEESGLPADLVEDVFAAVGPKYLDIMKSLGWEKPAVATVMYDWVLERDLVLEGLRFLISDSPRTARWTPGLGWTTTRPVFDQLDAARVFVERNEFRRTTSVMAGFEIRDLAVLMLRGAGDAGALVNETARQIAEKLIRMEEARHLLIHPTDRRRPEEQERTRLP